MRIGLQTWGSYGDIRPFIALAKGLDAAGHKVTLIITGIDKDYQAYLPDTGFSPHFTCEQIATPIMTTKVDGEAKMAAITKLKNPIKQLTTLLEYFFYPADQAMYNAAETLCQQNDLVIGHYFHYPLKSAADKYGKPYISVSLSHFLIPNAAQPPLGMPNLGQAINALIWQGLLSSPRKHTKPAVNKLRENNGIPPLDDNAFDRLFLHPDCNIIAVSKALIPDPLVWDSKHHICGFFDDPSPSEIVPLTLDNPLEDFLQSGPPPVYMGFGSMTPPSDAGITETAELLIAAAQKADCRAVIQLPFVPQGLAQQYAHRANHIHFLTHCPHHALFPRCAAVVHHGGAGTTQAALLAGTPSIIVAHIDEQRLWGLALYNAGIAQKPLLRRKLNAKQLARHIKTLLAMPPLADAAKTIAKQAKNENGVANAINIIENHYALITQQ